MSNLLEITNIEQNIKRKISNELLKISFTPKYSGTTYLIESIYLILQNNNLLNNLNKNIYPIIANKYNTNISTIKVDIYNAILESYCNCNADILNTYLHKTLINKPYVKDIITAVLNNII